MAFLNLKILFYPKIRLLGQVSINRRFFLCMKYKKLIKLYHKLKALKIYLPCTTIYISVVFIEIDWNIKSVFGLLLFIFLTIIRWCYSERRFN